MSNRNIMPKIRNKLIEIKSLLNSQACGEENEICVAFCFNWNRVSNIGIKIIIYNFHVNLGKLFSGDREGDGRTDEQTDIKFSLTLVPESIPIVEYFLSIDLNFSSLIYEINLNGITVFIWWQKSLLFDTLITNHNWSECLGYEACTIPPLRISLLTLKEIQKAEIC